MSRPRRAVGGSTIGPKTHISRSEVESEQWLNSEAQDRSKNSPRFTLQSITISTRNVISTAARTSSSIAPLPLSSGANFLRYDMRRMVDSRKPCRLNLTPPYKMHPNMRQKNLRRQAPETALALCPRLGQCTLDNASRAVSSHQFPHSSLIRSEINCIGARRRSGSAMI